MKASPSDAPEGGITIIPRGSTPTLIAQGKVLDSVTGFSTTLSFPAPDVQIASALHASGVPIGTPTSDSPYHNTGNFVPHVIVRNLLGSPQSVTITAEYPGTTGIEQIALAPISVGGYSTVDQPLDYVLSELPAAVPYCSIRIQYSGPAGSVVAQVSSVEQKSSLVVDSHVVNEGNGWAGSGANPWHLDDQTESFVFLTNMGDGPCDIGFQVTSAGVHYYLTNLSLKAHETRVINLRELRDAQKPDLMGSTIPASATDGAVIWNRLNKVPVMGRLVVLRVGNGISSNYDCCICPCPDSYDNLDIVLPGTTSPLTDFWVVVTGTQQLSARATFSDCNGTRYYTLPTDSSGWSSADATVASVTNTSSSHGLATGVKGGTAAITATYQHQSCASSLPCDCQTFPLDASSTAHVQVPTSLRVLSVSVLPTGTTGNYGCIPDLPPENWTS